MNDDNSKAASAVGPIKDGGTDVMSKFDLIPSFDPGDEFDAMADWFRVRVCELAQEASKAAIYRDLEDGRQLECFMAGAFTGAVGVCLAMAKPESWDALMEAITNYLPDARRNAEEILEDGRKRLDGAP